MQGDTGDLNGWMRRIESQQHLKQAFIRYMQQGDEIIGRNGIVGFGKKPFVDWSPRCKAACGLFLFLVGLCAQQTKEVVKTKLKKMPVDAVKHYVLGGAVFVIAYFGMRCAKDCFVFTVAKTWSTASPRPFFEMLLCVVGNGLCVCVCVVPNSLTSSTATVPLQLYSLSSQFLLSLCVC